MCLKLFFVSLSSSQTLSFLFFLKTHFRGRVNTLSCAFLLFCLHLFIIGTRRTMVRLKILLIYWLSTFTYISHIPTLCSLKPFNLKISIGSYFPRNLQVLVMELSFKNVYCVINDLNIHACIKLWILIRRSCLYYLYFNSSYNRKMAPYLFDR